MGAFIFKSLKIRPCASVLSRAHSYTSVSPPSMVMVVPVVYEASSEAR